jgi:hypothetical protein
VKRYAILILLCTLYACSDDFAANGTYWQYQALKDACVKDSMTAYRTKSAEGQPMLVITCREKK